LLAVEKSGSSARFWCWDNQPADQSNHSFLMDYPQINYLSGVENIGFGRAYNILITEALAWDADYFLVVNPDTLWSEEAIEKLLAAIMLNDKLGSVVPKVFYWDFLLNKKTKRLDSCGIVKLSGLRFVDIGQGETDHGRFDNAKVLGPSGCAGLYRVSALQSVTTSGQYFDELMFMYKEDSDLAMRLKLAGWKSELVPSAGVWHDRSVAGRGIGLLARLKAQATKNQKAKLWSRKHQLVLVWKYWRQESLFGLMKLFFGLVAEGLYALIFDRSLLSAWTWFWKNKKRIIIPKRIK